MGYRRCGGRCISAVLILALWHATVYAQDVRVLYVGDAAGSVWRGVALGEKEANILGQFTGQTYRVEPVTPNAVGAVDVTHMPVAVVAATDADMLRQLGTQFASLGVAVFNLTADDEALRQSCTTNLLHTLPSARMKADAVAQWQQKHPQAQVQAQAWHHDFTKFAARELNNRFRKLHGVSMDDPAWAGWAALKMISETVARTQTTAPEQVLAYLRNELEFDGQKGVPHTFRDTGQLRQPLLLVEADKLVGEAPVRGVVDTANLDSLGLASCKP